MIDKIIFLKSNNNIPYANLSLEEVLFQNLKKDEMIIYLWQNEHTVVIGHNQNAYTEVNLKALSEDKGFVARRMTGGGAVYHDLGNLNFSFILNKEDYDVKNQLNIIINALKPLNIYAELSGRNDICVNGKKISGNAFFDNKERCLHHGTILINADMNILPKYLNVSESKLKGKGVNSISSRVINLKEINPEISVNKVIDSILKTVKKQYKDKIFENQYLDDLLKNKDFNDKYIKLKEKYQNENYILGDNILLETKCEKRFNWGGVDIRLNINQGVIKDIKIYSDSLDVKSIEKAEEQIKGMKILNPVKTDNEIINDIINLIIA